MKKIKEDYLLLTNGGKEGQLFHAATIIAFLPAVFLENNEYKIIRFISILITLLWFVVVMPVSGVLLFLGFIQMVWQES